MSASTARSWALLVYAWERLRVSARYRLASFEGRLVAFLRISRCPSSRNQHRATASNETHWHMVFVRLSSIDAFVASGPIDLEDNCECGWRGD
ncbi:hypothetical protein DFH11DRAFT_1605904 [Phellopilus nigrolimitatus]|nr:hypothetical protein DFH11DRAFT_1605904 [Phellopilus nigrolimitatus]